MTKQHKEAENFLTPGDGMAKKKERAAIPCDDCEGLDGFVDPDLISDVVRKMVGKYKGGCGKENRLKIYLNMFS